MILHPKFHINNKSMFEVFGNTLTLPFKEYRQSKLNHKKGFLSQEAFTQAF